MRRFYPGQAAGPARISQYLGVAVMTQLKFSRFSTFQADRKISQIRDVSAEIVRKQA